MAEQFMRMGTRCAQRLPKPRGNFLLPGCSFPPPSSSQVTGLSEGVCVFVCFSMGSIRRQYPSSLEARGIPE